jgi:RNase P subunit RPR2
VPELPELTTRSGEPWPKVMCPGCQASMIPIKKKPTALEGMVEVVYSCVKCRTETLRIYKDA